MIIYNVTVKVENEIRDEWVKWMKNKHIPDVMATGCFKEYRFSKILVDDEDGVNYSIQYLCDSMEMLESYQENHASDLQKEHTLRYTNKFVAFRTLLELEEQG